MKNSTIGTKISLACTALVALTIVIGTVAIVCIGNINGSMTSVVTESLPGIYSIGQMSELIKDQKVAMVSHIAVATPDQKSAMEANIADLENRIAAVAKDYEKTITGTRSRELFERFSPSHQRLLRVWAGIQPLSRDLKTREAMDKWLAEAIPLTKERAKTIDDLMTFNKNSGDAMGAAALSSGSNARFLCISILLFAICFGAGLAYAIVRGIGNVLKRTVGDLSEGASQVSSASGQISESSQSLAQGASELAASLGETSASTEELASMTRKNAGNSNESAQLMEIVDRNVRQANATLAQMMTSMREITGSSAKISKIIKVIDEIAFQTNILALNAAVEAARAGDAGMGFAVVADEVRNLAQRSAQAAKDTAELIEDSIAKSNEGGQRLNEVADATRSITESATKVKILVDEVNLGSQEQARGIEQISKSIAQMEKVTQTTAASSEQSAAAAQELNAQAQVMREAVAQLRAMVDANSSPAWASEMPQSRGFRRLSAPAVPLLSAPGRTQGDSFPLEESLKEF